MSLKDIPLKYEYRSNNTNLVSSFYVPCLMEAQEYWRAVGYFTGQGLALAAKGLSSLVNKGG